MQLSPVPQDHGKLITHMKPSWKDLPVCRHYASDVCLITQVSLPKFACAEFDAHRKFELHIQFGYAVYCTKPRLATQQLEQHYLSF